MKLKILQENLSEALNTASRFSSSKVQLPILANVLLSARKNKLLISATNLENSSCLTIGANVSEEGEITVPAKLFSDIVSNLNAGQIEIESEKEHLKLTSQNFSSQISGMNSSDFPNVPQEIDKANLKIDSGSFSSALSQVLFAVSTDETRPVLTGVLMIVRKNELVLVSTDGFRLSQKRLKIDNPELEFSFIVPRNTLTELARLSQGSSSILLSFKAGESQIIFGVGDCVLTSRLIEGEFPKFEDIIPKQSKIKLNVDKEDLLRSVKLASVFARESANVVKMKIRDNSLELSSENQINGSQVSSLESKIDGDLGKEGFVVAFNFRFMEEFLNSTKSDDILIEFSDVNDPGVFREAKDKDFLHLIMPVKV